MSTKTTLLRQVNSCAKTYGLPVISDVEANVSTEWVILCVIIAVSEDRSYRPLASETEDTNFYLSVGVHSNRPKMQLFAYLLIKAEWGFSYTKSCISMQEPCWSRCFSICFKFDTGFPYLKGGISIHQPF